MLKGQMAEIPFFPLLRLRAAVAQAHSIQFLVIAAVLAAAALVPHFRGVQGTLRLYRHHKETMAAVVWTTEGMAAVAVQVQ
jgi:Mg2+/Co2+ transporter CorC